LQKRELHRLLVQQKECVVYTISLISTEQKETLSEKFLPRVKYELKSEIYGCCIKLLCDDHTLKDTWEDNFYSMSQNVRSHGRLFVFTDPDYLKDSVLFDPYSKTAFLINFTYYGWIKSIALSLAGDILEDEHGIFSVHGACLDINGQGMCVIGISGSGKTTQTYGLLKDLQTRIVSDDWFFSRVYGPDILAYGSEKNFYIRQDLEKIWKEFEGLVGDGNYDTDGRAIADIRWIIGKGRILPLTTLKSIVVLKREMSDENTVQTLDPETGLKFFEDNHYFNPHLLVTNADKTRIRNRYVSELLNRTRVYLVNTRGTPAETQRWIRSLVGVSQSL
jgi:hypothetical protein